MKKVLEAIVYSEQHKPKLFLWILFLLFALLFVIFLIFLFMLSIANSQYPVGYKLILILGGTTFVGLTWYFAIKKGVEKIKSRVQPKNPVSKLP
jgi:hypothetical protein